MNFEVESRNGILHVKDDELRFDWLERHHIILSKFMMCYLSRHWKVAPVDLFGRVNVIELWTRYVNPLYEPLVLITLWEQSLALSDYVMGNSSTWEGAL